MKEDNYLIKELEEDYKRDVMYMYFRTYWKHIFIGLFITVALLIYFLSNNAKKTVSKARVSSELMHMGLFCDKASSIIANHDEIRKNMHALPKGLKRILELTLACNELSYGNGDSGIDKAFVLEEVRRFIDSEQDIFWKDLAMLLYISLSDIDNKFAELDQLSAVDRPLRLLALEMKAILYLQNKDYEKAQRVVKHMREKEDLLPNQMSRLDLLQRMLDDRSE